MSGASILSITQRNTVVAETHSSSVVISVENKNSVSVVLNSGPPGPPGVSWTRQAAVKFAWDVAYATNYTEFTYSSGIITQINIWDTSAKVTHLFRKTFSYTGSSLTSVVTTDYLTNDTLTTVFAYSGGNISNITRTYVAG